MLVSAFYTLIELQMRLLYTNNLAITAATLQLANEASQDAILALTEMYRHSNTINIITSSCKSAVTVNETLKSLMYMFESANNEPWSKLVKAAMCRDLCDRQLKLCDYILGKLIVNTAFNGFVHNFGDTFNSAKLIVDSKSKIVQLVLAAICMHVGDDKSVYKVLKFCEKELSDYSRYSYNDVCAAIKSLQTPGTAVSQIIKNIEVMIRTDIHNAVNTLN